MILEQNIRQNGVNVSAKTNLKEQHVKLAFLHGVEIIVINAAMDIFWVMENVRVKCLMKAIFSKKNSVPRKSAHVGLIKIGFDFASS